MLLLRTMLHQVLISRTLILYPRGLKQKVHHVSFHLFPLKVNNPCLQLDHISQLHFKASHTIATKFQVFLKIGTKQNLIFKSLQTLKHLSGTHRKEKWY